MSLHLPRCLIFLSLLWAFIPFSQAQSSPTDSSVVVLIFDPNEKNLVFIPEIEDLLEDLEIYTEDTGPSQKRYKIINIMRLREGDDAESLMEDISTYYGSTASKRSDPNRDGVYQLLRSDISNANSLIEVRIKNIDEILFFEFVRYDIDSAKNAGQDKKPVYKSSATSIISLSEISNTNIKEEFRFAIHKVFQETNQRPEAYIESNGTQEGNTYYFGVGDTLSLQARVTDFDSPEGDLFYRWYSVENKKAPLLPLKPNIPYQNFVLKDTGQYQIVLGVNDRINPSKEDTISIHVIEAPKIRNVRFVQTKMATLPLYYWDFGGRPFYYSELDQIELTQSPPLQIELPSDQALGSSKDLNVQLEYVNKQAFSSISVSSLHERDQNKANLSTFKLIYGDPVQNERNGVRIMAKLHIDSSFTFSPGDYLFRTTLSNFGVKSEDAQPLKIEMNKIKRLSFTADIRQSVIPIQDSFEARGQRFNYTYRSTLLSLGIHYTLSPEFNGFIVPGVFVIVNQPLQYNLRGGLEFEPSWLALSRNRRLGIEASGNITTGIYNGVEARGTEAGDRIVWGSGGIYFKTYLKSIFQPSLIPRKPEKQLKIGIFYDYMGRVNVSDAIGIQLGWTLHTFAKRRNRRYTLFPETGTKK